jgi:hypothetical protein
MMNGNDMTGWSWLGMAAMAIVMIAIVGLVVWGITSRRPHDREGTRSG